MKNIFNTEEFAFLKSLKSGDEIYEQYTKKTRCGYDVSLVLDYTTVDKLVERDFISAKLDFMDAIRKDEHVIENPDIFLGTYVSCVKGMEKIMFGNYEGTDGMKYYSKVYEMYTSSKNSFRNFTQCFSFEDCIKMEKEEMKSKVRDFLEKEGAYEYKFSERGMLCRVIKNSLFASDAKSMLHDIEEMYKL